MAEEYTHLPFNRELTEVVFRKVIVPMGDANDAALGLIRYSLP
jgi:hypothetical protein